jgi:hypothetical protein
MIAGWRAGLKAAAAMMIILMAGTARAQVAQPVSVPDPTQPAAAPEFVSVGQRAHPEYDSPGLHLGGFIANPSLDIGEEFNSNIYGLPVVKSDFITQISPALDLISNWNDNAVGFHAEGDIAKHARFTADDTTNAIVQANGRLDIFHDQTLTLGLGYQALHEDRSSPDSIAQAQVAGSGSFARNPTPFAVTTGQFDYVYAPSRIGLELIGNVNVYDFSNVPTLDNRLEINSDQNRGEYTLTPRVSYTFNANYKAFVQVSGDVRSYDTVRDASPEHYKRSSTGYNIAVGNVFDIDRVITGQFYIGYQNQTYDDPRLSTISGLSFGGSVLWNVTQLTSVKLSGTRSAQETILQGASGLFDTTLEASVEHEILRNILISLGVTYDDAAYQGVRQTDDTYGINASVRWKINRYLTAGAAVNYTKRSSNVGIDRFNRNQVIIDIKGQF